MDLEARSTEEMRFLMTVLQDWVSGGQAHLGFNFLILFLEKKTSSLSPKLSQSYHSISASVYFTV